MILTTFFPIFPPILEALKPHSPQPKPQLQLHAKW